MKKTRFFILASLAAATLGLSSCVVDDDYDGGYAYVERPYYRDYYYGPRPRYYHRTYSDGYYHHGPIGHVRGNLHAARADVHNAIFH
ncbi:hypothetical protein DES53_104256 [Roseimicrobium gellanilyticum]|uniref:Lipoprotein n=1 Tax=Roseimicrobium gellanilyticum TaxID=748857 RepID=A0A366HNS6_9BACT|nr:neuropeptide-like protein 29 [Roseimicrobium gellanilyticum]RBP44436.1 hypothetical protein DES53_104256 [Roseimicrobium gellanilyticum]